MALLDIIKYLDIDNQSRAVMSGAFIADRQISELNATRAAERREPLLLRGVRWIVRDDLADCRGCYFVRLGERRRETNERRRGSGRTLSLALTKKRKKRKPSEE